MAFATSGLKKRQAGEESEPYIEFIWILMAYLANSFFSLRACSLSFQSFSKIQDKMPSSFLKHVPLGALIRFFPLQSGTWLKGSILKVLIILGYSDLKSKMSK